MADALENMMEEHSIPAFLELTFLINMSAAPSTLGNLNASIVLLSLHNFNFHPYL